MSDSGATNSARIRSSVVKCVRDPTPVTVELVTRSSEDEMTIAANDDDARVVIMNESCTQSFSGKLGVKEDGTVFVTDPTETSNDASCKYIYLHIDDIYI